ncbi:ectomycorrhiza-upregulated binuclear zinc transcription factor [Lentinula edodes]|uniref:Ectomycorrhiza-upregulated binuclear zinc transcription factor n=1 Tax=Lentinula edodes TaxID=5353 RepID=A0A1Q3EKN3_LENED|nr:ectomycorrhiza-upregulated binuclear zinc transcription factor [Lentinula edodes]
MHSLESSSIVPSRVGLGALKPPLSKNADTRSSRKNGNSLRRGKACINCRHLKIVNLPSRASRLQSDIEELLARIEVLETSNGSSRKNVPTQSSSATSPSLSLSLSLDSPQSPHSSNLTQSVFSLDVDYSSSDSEPPVHERANLIDNFISRCATLAFFLNLETFRSSALLPLPLGDPQRPSPALLACVYLWGLRISSSPWKSAKGTAFLRRARRFIALEGVGAQNRTQVMHLIQAKILLIIYLVHGGQFLEAEFHGNGAISLVLSYGLHKIIPTSDGVYDDPEGRLPPCTGPVDQAERINAFCNSFGSLDSYLEIRTPLPMNTQNYGPEDTARTLYDFLHDTAPQRPETSSLGIYSKSAILLHRAVYLHKQIDTGDRHKISEECSRLEQIVLNFYSSLPEISCIKELEARSSPFPPFICSEKLSLMYAAYTRRGNALWHGNNVDTRNLLSASRIRTSEG